jgi:hypothetical protein
MAFRPAASPVRVPVAKLGGQSTWLERPRWPWSAGLRAPMMFVGRHLTRRLEGDLLAAGFTVVRVHTRLMAGERRAGGSVASPTRSTRWRSRGPRCWSRTCRSRAWTARPGR